MTSMLTLYILIYFYTLYVFIMFIISCGFTKKASQYSMSELMGMLRFYRSESPIIYLLIFQLTGIPPFIYFFIKFSMIAIILDKLSLFTAVLLFLVLLLGVFFYLKVFSHTNFKYTNDKLRDSCTPLVGEKAVLFQKLRYKLTYVTIVFTTINLLSCVFFIDLVLILS